MIFTAACSGCLRRIGDLRAIIHYAFSFRTRFRSSSSPWRLAEDASLNATPRSHKTCPCLVNDVPPTLIPEAQATAQYVESFDSNDGRGLNDEQFRPPGAAVASPLAAGRRRRGR